MASKTPAREPDKYAAITLTDDNPILPDTVKKILDQMPAFSDICEMRITSKDGPIPTRTVAIYYTTVMPRKIDHKRVSFNAAFGISPEQLANAINSLPLTARILTIDAIPRGYSTCVDITYYTQPKRKTEDA